MEVAHLAVSGGRARPTRVQKLQGLHPDLPTCCDGERGHGRSSNFPSGQMGLSGFELPKATSEARPRDSRPALSRSRASNSRGLHRTRGRAAASAARPALSPERPSFASEATPVEDRESSLKFASASSSSPYGSSCGSFTSSRAASREPKGACARAPKTCFHPQVSDVPGLEEASKVVGKTGKAWRQEPGGQNNIIMAAEYTRCIHLRMSCAHVASYQLALPSPGPSGADPSTAPNRQPPSKKNAKADDVATRREGTAREARVLPRAPGSGKAERLPPVRPRATGSFVTAPLQRSSAAPAQKATVNALPFPPVCPARRPTRHSGLFPGGHGVRKGRQQHGADALVADPVLRICPPQTSGLMPRCEARQMSLMYPLSDPLACPFCIPSHRPINTPPACPCTLWPVDLKPRQWVSRGRAARPLAPRVLPPAEEAL